MALSTCYERLVAGSLLVIFTLTPAALAEPLPEGLGLAAGYPADQGLADDPAVLLFEDFEHGSLEQLGQRWDNVSNAGGAVLSFADDVPPGSAGRRSLHSTATLGENHGGHLYTRLPEPVDDVVFVRFYVRFAEDAGYLHHFVRVGGYHPATRWPQGGAGTRPTGDDRFVIGTQPFAERGRVEPPGAWAFYVYWPEMKQSADGRYWGNGLRPAEHHVAPRGQWQCVEVMVRLNSAPAKRDGELALWLDGELVAHIAPGSRHTRWTGMGFAVDEDGEETFEGFRWRTDERLKLNFLWLLHYVTPGSIERAGVEDPDPHHRVQFDHVVVAREYIGPLAPIAAGEP